MKPYSWLYLPPPGRYGPARKIQLLSPAIVDVRCRAAASIAAERRRTSPAAAFTGRSRNQTSSTGSLQSDWRTQSAYATYGHGFRPPEESPLSAKSGSPQSVEPGRRRGGSIAELSASRPIHSWSVSGRVRMLRRGKRWQWVSFDPSWG